jgi:hypothetical protein
MSYEAIGDHLTEMYGLEVSPAKISQITDRLIPVITEWRNRPLETVYPNLTELREECFKEYQAADKKLKHDSEWKPILKNLALFFSGIGTALAVVSLYYRATTGRYGLFDNRDELLSNAPNPSNPSANSTQNYKNRLLNEETNPEELEENAPSFGA